MFNIASYTIIEGLDKIGCSVGHLQACLCDKNKHEAPKFSYWGKYVSRGAVLVHAKTGDFTIKFYSKNGFLKSVKIL